MQEPRRCTQTVTEVKEPSREKIFPGFALLWEVFWLPGMSIGRKQTSYLWHKVVATKVLKARSDSTLLQLFRLDPKNALSTPT